MVSRPGRWYREGPPHWWAILPHGLHDWLVDYWRWDGVPALDATFWLIRVGSEEDGKALIDLYKDVGLADHPLAWEYTPNQIIDVTSHDVWRPTETEHA